jgi:hypothetical protein
MVGEDRERRLVARRGAGRLSVRPQRLGGASGHPFDFTVRCREESFFSPSS